MLKEQSPEYLAQLQAKTGLTKTELAERLNMSVKSWDNLISKNCIQKLPGAKFELLMLLAGEHPEYLLVRR